MRSERGHASSIVIILAVFFTASALRSPITSLGSLSLSVQDDLQLTGSAMGMLTTLPLVIFAISASFMSLVADRFGKRCVLIVGMLLVAVGILLRSFAGDVGLFAGTIMLGAGIATGNVLLPAVVKEYFSLQIGLMTGFYTTTISIFSGGFAGVSPMLASSLFDWRITLALIAPLALIAAILWICTKVAAPFGGKSNELDGESKDPNDPPEPGSAKSTTSKRTTRIFHKGMLGNSLTWWVTGLFGLQSVLFFCIIAWLPSILSAQGISDGTIALCAAFVPIMGIPCNMLLPPLAQRLRSQRLLGALSGVACVVGIGLLWVANTDAIAIFVAAFLGLSLGAPFCLSMFYFGYRTENALDSARLSSISQTCGYLLAAIGPTCLGAIYDISASWNWAIGVLLVGAAGIILCGWKAGQGTIPSCD